MSRSLKDSNEYYYLEGDERIGPFSRERLTALLKNGILPPHTKVVVNNSVEQMILANIVELPPGEKDVASDKTQTTDTDSFYSSFLSVLDRITGLPRLHSLPSKLVVDEVLKKHSHQEAENIFNAQNSEGGIPWLFSRILLLGLLAGFLLLWGMEQFGNPRLLPGYLFFWCTVIPVATFVFLLELCGLKSTGLFGLMKAFFLGGVLSLIISLVLFTQVSEGFYMTFGATIAGPVEEVGKLVAVVIVAREWTRAKRARDGILIGAAVGTGFATFETAGYIFEAFLVELGALVQSGYYDGSHLGLTLLMRAVFAPFCHIIWTGIAAGALWMVMGGEKFKFAHLQDSRFLRLFAISVVLHAFWNANFGLPFLSGDWGYFAKFLLIGFVGWYALLQLYTFSDKSPMDASSGDERPEDPQP